MPHTIEFIAGPAPLPMLLVALAIVTLGIIVVARERVNAVTLSFLILTICVSTWLTSIALMTAVSSEDAALVFARAAYVGVALIPAAVLQFTMALLGVTRRHVRALITAWIAGMIFVGLFTGTSLLLSGTWRYSWGFYPRLTGWSVLFLAWFALLLAGSLIMLATTRAQSEREHQRNASFFLALSVGYLGSIDYLPAFGVAMYPIGCLAILGFIVLAARSIFRFRLSDLTSSFVAERLLQTMHGGVIVVDTIGRVRLANEVAARLLGWSVAEMQQLDLPALLGVTRLPATDSESFCRDAITRDRIVHWRRRDGSAVELSLSASAVRDEQNNALGVLYALADVSDRRRAEANEYGATHDLLTTLPNRARFAALFQESKERIVASNRVPTVLFIDLDGFKAVNDQHGHAAGDAVLRMVSTRIRNSIRGDDVLARYAGDEFVVLLDLARAEDASFVATKLLRIVSEPYTIEEGRVTIGASIGAAFYPDDGATAGELLRVADQAMYGAKRAGKGRAHVTPRRTDVAAPPPYTVNATA
ncbi:MAG TPA: diguanylate cyclase [Thermoanaerobaculia bacterium]